MDQQDLVNKTADAGWAAAAAREEPVAGRARVVRDRQDGLA
jgi:hypothetical protein